MKSKEANDIKDLLALYRSTACQILLVDANTDDDDADHLEFLHQYRSVEPHWLSKALLYLIGSGGLPSGRHDSHMRTFLPPLIYGTMATQKKTSLLIAFQFASS